MVTRQPQGQGDLATEPRSIELRDYAQVLRRRWVLVIVMTMLGALLGVGYALHQGRAYVAMSQVVVEPATQGPLHPPAAPNLQVNMVTEQAVAQSAPVAVLAAKLMHSPYPEALAPGKLDSHLTVTVPVLSNVLQLTWKAGSPKAAQEGANAFAEAYLTYRHDMLSGQVTRLTATLNHQVRMLQREINSVTAKLNGLPSGSPQRQTLTVSLSELNAQLRIANSTLAVLPTYNVSGGNMIKAALPLSPGGMGRKIIVLIGAFLGLMIGVVAAFLWEAFDDRLHDPAELERKLGAPTLAILPSLRHPTIVTTVMYPDSPAANRFRALRTTLISVAAGKNLCSIVMVGVDSSVSSSQVAAELGVALAESGRRTLLIAADIRGSSLAQMFSVPNDRGLTDLLAGRADPEAIMRHPKDANGVPLSREVVGHLAIVPSGPLIAQPLSVLDSAAMARFLAGLREEYDFVILDSPPAVASADFLALARLADGVIAIAGEGRSKGQAVERLRHRLEQVGEHLVGGVFITRSHAPAGRRPPEPVSAELIGGAFTPEQADNPGAGRAGGIEPKAEPTRRLSSGQRDAAPNGAQRLGRRLS